MAPQKKDKSAVQGTIAPPAIPKGDRAWRVAQLAAILASNLNHTEHLLIGKTTNPALSNRHFDPFFAAALKRADSLLRWAEGIGGVVHAYQIFEEGAVQTELQLVQTFSAWNWARLSSKKPIMALMQSIRSTFQKESAASCENVEHVADARVRTLVVRITDSLRGGFEKHFGMPVELLDAETKVSISTISASLVGQLFEHFAADRKHERFLAIYEEQLFFEWCFPEPSSAQRAERLYRPHEIFRRCAGRPWFQDQLVRSRNELDAKLIPFPPDDHGELP